MNADINVPITKRSSSPRPPADGDEVRKFYDRSYTSEPYKNWKMECQSKALCAENAETSVKSIEPSSCSPPNPYKWAESFQCLLEDLGGVNLFEKFLNQEGQDTKCLKFLFACRGVKKQDPRDRETLYKLIKVIFRDSRKLSAISDETKEEIKQKLSSNTGVDNTIFDAAQREIEAYITKTTYPNFLRSDLYIQHLRKLQDENSSETDGITTSEAGEYLPTVHEDAELQISYNNKITPLTKSNLIRRCTMASSKFKSEGPGGFLQSPYNYHAGYNSYLPASAQDSELQSLSSGAQTDDTMSLTDSNLDISMSSRSKQQKRPQKTSKHLNKEKTSNEETFIPRTQRFDPNQILDPSSPLFYELVCKRLSKVIEDRKRDDYMKRNLECYVEQEENDQSILDEHISRVFDPVSGCTSPKRPSTDVTEKSRVHPQHSSGYSEPSSSYATVHKHSQASQFTVPNSIKGRRDHDNQSPDSALNDSTYYDKPVDYSRRSKDSSKRYAYKKNSSMTDSLSSFVDSGISLGCESIPSYTKASHCLETRRATEQEKEHSMWRNSPTSPDLSRPGSSRKSLGHNSSSQDIGCSQWTTSSAQYISQDMQGPGHPHTDLTLNEARRRLEDENRTKIKSRKPNRKSYSLNVIEAATANTVCNDVTRVAYCYGRHSVPYLSKIPGKDITLRQFKTLLSKKGNFRYFFKRPSNDFGTGAVFEEVNEDHTILPLWEGKVFGVIETMDDNCIM